MSTARVARFPGTTDASRTSPARKPPPGGFRHALPGWPPGTLQANPRGVAGILACLAVRYLSGGGVAAVVADRGSAIALAVRY